MGPLARRALVIPLYFGLLPALLVGLPLLALAATVVDLSRTRRWGTLRTLAFAVLYLGCEVAGILISLGLWLGRALWPGLRGEGYLDAHYRLQAWWARTLLLGACRIYGMRLVVEGDEDLGAGPLLVFVRHASLGDTVLPAVVAARRGLRLRYVIKRELLWDPCLDIVGNRLPNAFVRRESADSAREIAEVARLAEGLGARDGVLIYPEGTRFSQAKRQRILDRLAQAGDRDRLEAAAVFTRVLPPKLGGPLALLDAAPSADVMLCAHVGFEGASHFSTLAGGDLVGRVIRMQWWRVPRAQVPEDREARIAWLNEQWRRVDTWVGLHGATVPGGAVAEQPGTADAPSRSG